MVKTQTRLIIFSCNLLLFVLSSFMLSAQNEPRYTSLLEGDSIYAGNTITVKDSVFFNPLLKPNILRTNKVTNIISFRINEYSTLALPDSFEVSIKIRLIATNKENLLDSGTEKTLTINYNKFKAYKSKDIYYLQDVYQMQIRIVKITVHSPSQNKIPAVLELENKIEIDRDYVMNPVIGNQMDCSANAIRKINSDISTIEEFGELRITWPPDRIVEMYDVEWTYIDQSALVSGKYHVNGQLSPQLLFKNNATRITTTSYAYMIPLLYDGQGSLFFRVRGVQEDPAGELITTLWSSEFTGGLGRYDFTGHERKLNWQATTTFAEDAKRKSVVQYFDGSLRSRQTVTRDNTTQTTVVAETLYDKQGRPVIQVMPAPTLSKLIGYTPGFNVAAINSREYDKGRYDTLLSAWDYCGKGAESMGVASGGNQYYSPGNPLHADNFHQLIPDAKGYAFTETQYLPDNTGRINKQGGVGKDFQVGTGHETKYYYATPGQYDLDALFGTEAGEASHYQKNTVRDANGQYSVSYLDMHGRTIATALAGLNPASLRPLNSYRDSFQTESLLNLTNNVINGNSIQSTKSLLVPVKGNHVFNYSLGAESLTREGCRQQNICYDCLYDLTINVADDNCNNQLWGGKPLIITRSNFKLFEIDTTCALAKPVNIDTAVFLEEGSYTITKTLTISKEAMQYYRDSLFIAHNTCLTYEEILAEQKEIVRKNISCDVTPVQQYEYQSYRQDMLTDLYPMVGQYADTDTYGCFSIFSGPPEGPYLYQSNNFVYVDEEGKEDSVMNSKGNFVPPNQLTKEEFMVNFKNSWANTLLIVHPEYSLLIKYESFEKSLKWNEDFANTETFSEAKAKGYLNPTGNRSQQPASGFPVLNPDPLYSAYSESDLARQSIESGLFNFQNIDGVTVSLWGFATAAGKCPNTHPVDEKCIFQWNQPGNPFNESQLCEGELDMAWKLFRSQYLTKKNNWMMAYIKSVAGNPNISDPCTRNFITAAELLQQGGFSATAQDEGVVKDGANKFFEDNSKAFATRWWEQLKTGCNYYAPQDSSIIISYLVEVSKEGSDMDHPYGSSTVKPGSAYRFKSFEEVIRFYNDSTGRVTDINCNSYLMDKPLPYNQSAPLVRKDLYTKPDSCECTKITEYYNLYSSKTAEYGTFSNFMLKKYSTKISEGSLDSLRNLCDNTISCKYIPKSISLPTIFQCLFEAPCFPCGLVKGFYDSFLVKFPNQIPIKEEPDTVQQKINQVFVSYMNQQLGFSKSNIEYLNFMDSCKNYSFDDSTTSGDCDSLQNIFKDYVQNIKPGKVTHVFETQEGPAYTKLSQIMVNGAIQLPDSIRQRPGTWYNNYHVNTPKLCTNNGYTEEIRFKFLQNSKTGDVFYSRLGIGFTAQRYFGGSANGLTIMIGKSRYYLDVNPNALLNWMTFKVKVLPGMSYLYYNDKLVFQQSRDSSVPVENIVSFGMGLFGRQGCIDWVKVSDGQNNLKYFEDFNDADNPAIVDPSFVCSPQADCKTLFTNYFNQKKKTRYTFSQIDSVFFTNCGTHPDPCSSPYALGDTATVSCKKLDSLLNVYLQTNINPRSGYVDLDMRTFFGNKTPDEGPKGVFDINGNLIGNTVDGDAMAIKQSYTSIWNSSSVNTSVGTLSLLQSGRFRLQLNPGHQAPCRGITGQRYYQFDMPVPDQSTTTGSLLDGILCTSGTYIDFGDGAKTMADTLLNTGTTKTLLSGSGFTGSFWSKPVNDNPQYYVIHQYAQQSIAKIYTVTVYHSDIKGALGFDNYAAADATAISQINNLRGYWPQQVTELVFHSTQQASLNTGQDIKNYNQINTIDLINFHKGDGHEFTADGHEFTNNSFGPFTNNINLRGFWINYSKATPNNDTPFETSLPPDMSKRFPSIEFIRLENPSYRYNPALDFSFPDLHYLLIGLPLNSTQADSVIIQAARSKQSNGYIYFRYADNHTSASNAAIASLVARNWYLSGAGLNNAGNYIPPNQIPVNRQPLPAISAFSDFLNQYFGTALTQQQAFELYLQKCGYIPNTCSQAVPPNASLLLCGKTEALNEPFEYIQEDPCADSTNIAIITATERYRIYKDSLSGAFEEAYQQKCLNAINLENFTIKHPVSEYHYTYIIMTLPVI